MKYRYDLHVHSALSPCAENDMTPVTIVGTAKLNGLDFVAVSDHNSIKNVQVALAAGEAYGIKVVPAFELQTNEDVHILCLFKTYAELKAFFETVKFSSRANRPDIFGEQQIVDEDDNVVGTEPTMLLDCADISADDVPEKVNKAGGVAIPAHIDRDANSMLVILGAVDERYQCVELSTRATEYEMVLWQKTRLVLRDSDAHTLVSVKTGQSDDGIELEEYSVDCLIDTLRCGKTTL